MRITLSIDDHLASVLEQRAKELGIPFEEMVNRTIRNGLQETAETCRGRPPKVVPHSFGFRPDIDLDKLSQLDGE